MTEPNKRPAFEPAERLLTRPRYDPNMKRPVTTTVGAVLVVLRVVAGVLFNIELLGRATAAGDITIDDGGSVETLQLGVVAVVVVLAALLAIEALLAVFIYLGRNLPRVIVMVFAVLSISAEFVGWWAGGQEITFRTSLLSLAFDILILLALSSRSAAAYARRREQL